MSLGGQHEESTFMQTNPPCLVVDKSNIVRLLGQLLAPLPYKRSIAEFEEEVRRLFWDVEYVRVSWVSNVITVRCFPPGPDDKREAERLLTLFAGCEHEPLISHTILINPIKNYYET